MAKKRTEKGRTSFILYHSQREVLRYLTVKEKAALLQAIFDFEVTGECEELSGGAAVAFALIREQLRRDGQAYEQMCEENRKKAQMRWSGKSGERQRDQSDKTAKTTAESADQRGAEMWGGAAVCKKEKPADAGACRCMPTDTDTYTYTDTETDTDSDTDTDTDTDTETDTDTDTETDTEWDADGGASFSAALSRDARQPPAPRAREDIDAGCKRLFSLFWDAYPRKVHPERARQAWSALIGADSDRAAAVMRALSRAMREDYRFLDGHIPYPSNWLRNETPWQSDWEPPPNAHAERRVPPGQSCISSTFDTDEFFTRALERSYMR